MPEPQARRKGTPGRKAVWVMSVKAGDVVELTMEQVAFGGEGIGRWGNLVVFVPYTVDGDVVRVEILECRKRYARGRLQDILQPSPHRTHPPCKDYTQCGGCCYQHIAYAHQLLIKETQVRDAFERIGKMPSPPIRPVIASPEPYHYRLKADFHLRLQKGKAPALGFMSGASNRIVEIEQCKIVEESINQLYQDLRKKLLHGSWVPRRDRITLWSADNEGPFGGTNTERLRETWIIRTIKKRRLTVHRYGFFQANQYLIDTMIDRVITAAELTGSETVVDGFCGCGLFSLFLAPLAKTVHGIEGDDRAVQAARENAENNGLQNLFFHKGDVAEVVRRVFFNPPVQMDVLVLDPPRIGCGKDLLENILRLGPKRIVYVSCNPTTQARDIQTLIAGGYYLEYIQPLDMFPQTAHIEIIARLTR